MRLSVTVVSGRITDVQAESGPGILSSAAARWVKSNWQFRDDQNGTFTLPVDFAIQHEADSSYASENNPNLKNKAGSPRPPEQETSKLAANSPDSSDVEALLNATYQSVWKTLSPQQRVRLRDEEREFLKQREKLKGDKEAFVTFTQLRIELLKTYSPAP